MFLGIACAHVRVGPADQCSLTWVPESRYKKRRAICRRAFVVVDGAAPQASLHPVRSTWSTGSHMSLLGTADTMLVLVMLLPLALVQGDVFTNSFLVRLRDEAPGLEVARAVAERNGFDILGPVSPTAIPCLLSYHQIY